MKKILVKILMTTPVLIISPVIKGSFEFQKFEGLKLDIIQNSTKNLSEDVYTLDSQKFESKDALSNYLIRTRLIKSIGSNITDYLPNQEIPEKELKGLNDINNFTPLYKTASNLYVGDYNEAMLSYTDAIKWTSQFSYDGKSWFKFLEEAQEDYFKKHIDVTNGSFYKYKDDLFNANNFNDNSRLNSLGKDGYVIFKSPFIDLDEEYIYGTKDSLRSKVKSALKKHFFKASSDVPDWLKSKTVSFENSVEKSDYYKLDITPTKNQRVDFFYEDGNYDRNEAGKTGSIYLKNMADIDFIKNERNWNVHSFPVIGKNQTYGEINVTDYMGRKVQIVLKSWKMIVHKKGLAEFPPPDFKNTVFKETKKTGGAIFLYDDKLNGQPIKNTYEFIKKIPANYFQGELNQVWDKIFDGFYENFLFEKINNISRSGEWKFLGLRVKMLERPGVSKHDDDDLSNYFPLIDNNYINIAKNSIINSPSNKPKNKFDENLLESLDWESAQIVKIILDNKLLDESVVENLIKERNKEKGNLIDSKQTFSNKLYDILGSSNPVFNYKDNLTLEKLKTSSGDSFVTGKKSTKIGNSESELRENYFKYSNIWSTSYQEAKDKYGFKRLVEERDDNLIDRISGNLIPEFGYHSSHNINDGVSSKSDFYNPSQYKENLSYAYGFKNEKGEKLYFNNIQTALRMLIDSLIAGGECTIEKQNSWVYFYKEGSKLESFVFKNEREIDEWIKTNGYKLPN